MELRPIHVAGVLSVVATVAILTGCGGAIQPGQKSSTSTASNPYVSLLNISSDPYTATIQQGGKLDSTLMDGTRKFVIEVVKNKNPMGYIPYAGYISPPAYLSGSGLTVPVIDGTGSTAQISQFSQSPFQPVMLFTNDTVKSSVSGSWNNNYSTTSTSSWGPFTFSFSAPSFSCSGIDLMGMQGSTPVAGNGGLNAGLIGSLINPSTGTTAENYMIASSPSKSISAQALLLVGLNDVPSTTNPNWRQNVCMSLQVNQLQINRCINTSGATVKCP